ncbi:MAG: DUF3224 domain-containing protein [Hymenobacteraceae bacterium]|nr:DUF3224 domain-containing protein [Hymenobacteraceae bacterium]
MHQLIGQGTFEVQMNFQPPYDTTDAISMGRATFTKQFTGDLSGTGIGEMLSVLTPVKGSGSYVASERIEATLHGRSGSFVVQHTGRMVRGAQSLEITIVADSGTGELAGIAGQLTIDIVEKQHFYRIEYSLEVVNA